MQFLSLYIKILITLKCSLTASLEVKLQVNFNEINKKRFVSQLICKTTYNLLTHTLFVVTGRYAQRC